MATLHRIVRLIVHPLEEWDRIAGERTSVDALLRRVILPFSLLAPTATVIGMNLFDRTWDPLRGYQVPSDRIFSAGATTYFGTVGSILVLAGIFAVIAPMYGAKRDYRAALKVAAYGALPVLLAGATLIVPVMVILGVVACCHTLYLYWLGVERVLEVGQGDRAEFVGIAMVLLVMVSVLAGGLAGALGLF
jgi:hypothetical protein